MRFIGLGLKLRMKLYRDKVWMALKLDYLNEVFPRIDAGKNYTLTLKQFLIFIVKLISVSVAFVNQPLAVDPEGEGVLFDLARVCP